MKVGADASAPPPPLLSISIEVPIVGDVSIATAIEIAVAIHVMLDLTELALGFAAQLFRFATELLFRVSSDSADAVADLAFDLFAGALEPVFDAVALPIVRHVSP